MFKALILNKADGETAVTASVEKIERNRLPEGDVLVEVAYSSLNYKDGLAVTGRGKIIRGEYPFVPGVDLVGTIKESADSRYEPGDNVIVTGWGIGEYTWGGYSQEQRVKADWVVPLPDNLSMRDAMVIGTAGYTAMLSVMALEEHGLEADRGKVVVTGASGGAGSFAVALLASLGYHVVSSTGSEGAHGYLRDLGTQGIIPREQLSRGPERPMETARWAGAVDAVGGKTLAALIAQTERHGSIAAYGLAGGHELHTTVFPFILRGVNLLGIDSNTCPYDRRKTAWDRLAEEVSSDTLERILAAVISLDEVPARSEELLQGRVQGRYVVDVNA